MPLVSCGADSQVDSQAGGRWRTTMHDRGISTLRRQMCCKRQPPDAPKRPTASSWRVLIYGGGTRKAHLLSITGTGIDSSDKRGSNPSGASACDVPQMNLCMAKAFTFQFPQPAGWIVNSFVIEPSVGYLRAAEPSGGSSIFPIHPARQRRPCAVDPRGHGRSAI